MFDIEPGGQPLPPQEERKFLLDPSRASDIWLQASARLWQQPRDVARPVTYHRTTYFDTSDHAFFRGAGTVARRLRVREYATACTPGSALELGRSCFLELKQSAHGMRTKVRLELEAGDVDRRLAELASAGLVPCLTTWYQRAALADAAQSIRVTLDSDIRYCPPQPIGAPCDAPPAAFARASSLILEIKAGGPLPAWLRALVHPLEEASEFSKFGAGMEAAGLRTPDDSRLRCYSGAWPAPEVESRLNTTSGEPRTSGGATRI